MSIKYILKFEDGSYYGGIYNCELHKSIKQEAYIFDSIEEIQEDMQGASWILNKEDLKISYFEIVMLYKLPEKES